MEEEEIFSEIRRLNNLGYKDSQIAKQLGIKSSTVNYVKRFIYLIEPYIIENLKYKISPNKIQ